MTNDHHGEVLLRLLCDKELDNDLRELLLLDLEPRQLSETVENDAMTPDGAPVLFAYDCDLPRIRRFDTALRLQDRYGILICFDHQAEVLRRYCGNRVIVQAIDFDAFERRFCRREKKLRSLLFSLPLFWWGCCLAAAIYRNSSGTISSGRTRAERQATEAPRPRRCCPSPPAAKHCSVRAGSSA